MDYGFQRLRLGQPWPGGSRGPIEHSVRYAQSARGVVMLGPVLGTGVLRKVGADSPPS